MQIAQQETCLFSSGYCQSEFARLYQGNSRNISFLFDGKDLPPIIEHNFYFGNDKTNIRSLQTSDVLSRSFLRLRSTSTRARIASGLLRNLRSVDSSLSFSYQSRNSSMIPTAS